MSGEEDLFAEHRSVLFTVAYEMLGSAADADDVVQNAWLRWRTVDHRTIRDPRAYLLRTVTRQALNRLRTVSRRREQYIGEWLPEPVLTSPDVAEDVVLAESVSIAMLTVLETLTPSQRAVFVLREVFDVPYEEIAEYLGKSAPAVRQLARRAREQVSERRPRRQVTREEQERVVDRFVASLSSGDIQGLMDVLAPNVVVIADGGGVAPSVRRPVLGGERVASLLARISREYPGVEIGKLLANGSAAARIDPGGRLDTALTFVLHDDRIQRIYAVRNPEKLGRLDAEIELRR